MQRKLEHSKLFYCFTSMRHGTFISQWQRIYIIIIHPFPSRVSVSAWERMNSAFSYDGAVHYSMFIQILKCECGTTMASQCSLAFCLFHFYISLNWCQLNDFPKQFDLDGEPSARRTCTRKIAWRTYFYSCA